MVYFTDCSDLSIKDMARKSFRNQTSFIETTAMWSLFMQSTIFFFLQ